MGIKIDIVCGIILAVCTIAGVAKLYDGMVNKKPLAAMKGADILFPAILFDGFIYFIYTDLSSSVFPRNNLPFKLLLTYFLGAFFFSWIALVYSRLGKTEEAPEKSEDIPSDLEGRVEYWHTHDTGNTLQEFLGMTDSEYEKWGRGEHAPATDDTGKKEDK